jgi:multidrug efflux pump subunit AcrA (membrane-fusion protein)
MKKPLYLIGIVVLALALVYITKSLLNVVPTTNPIEPPDVNTVAYRIYGLIEPYDRPVYVNPPLAKRVDKIFVVAGDFIKEGEPLVELDRKTEKARLDSLTAEVQSKEAALAINKDRFERNSKLISTQVIDEFEFKQSQLEFELSQAELNVSKKNLAQSQVEYDQLLLTAPFDGRVYRMDVLLGQTFQPGDRLFIVGKKDLWVNLRVDSYWINRIKPGSYSIFNADTNKKLGEGDFIRKGLYMGPPNFLIEDPTVMVDIKYLEAFISFTPNEENLPIELVVYVEPN